MGLNFLEAVQALKDGRCKGIKRPCQRGTIVMAGNRSLIWEGSPTMTGEVSLSPNYYLATDYQLVGEKPQVEEVPVTKWAVLNLDGTISSLWDEYPKEYESPSFQIVELTDTYTSQKLFRSMLSSGPNGRNR